VPVLFRFQGSSRAVNRPLQCGTNRYYGYQSYHRVSTQSVTAIPAQVPDLVSIPASQDKVHAGGLFFSPPLSLHPALQPAYTVLQCEADHISLLDLTSKEYATSRYGPRGL
jgi:hypothetical protein